MKHARLTHIDLLESIAIFFVVVYHSTLYSWDFLSEPGFLNYLIYYIRTLFSTCVPLFFFANGYLLLGKEFHLGKHLRKTLTLVLRTFMWAAVILLGLYVIQGFQLSPSEFFNALWNWEFGWISHLWYLCALICLYVFFPLLKQAFDSNFPVFVYFTIAATLFTVGNTFLNHIVTAFQYFFSENPVAMSDFNYFNLFNPFRGIRGYSFAYFCLGGICFALKDKIEHIPLWKRNAISVAGILLSNAGLFVTGVLYSRIQGQLWDVVWNGYDSIFTFCNVIFIHLLCLNWHTDLPAIRTISSNTLGIYLLNGIVIAFLRPYLLPYSSLRNLPANLLFGCVIIFVCLVICFIVKKIPVCSKLLK